VIDTPTHFASDRIDAAHGLGSVVAAEHLARAPERSVIALLANASEAPAPFTQIEWHARRAPPQLLRETRIVLSISCAIRAASRHISKATP
jgi:hypothetical protein